MRVGGYWLAMSFICIINFAIGRETLSDTALTVFLVASWTFAGMWAEAIAHRRAASGPAPRKGEQP